MSAARPVRPGPSSSRGMLAAVLPSDDAAALSEDARVRFEALYERRPTWDVPRPQPAFVALAEAGRILSPVLDAGCGTGENALYLAARGHVVFGVDLVGAAIGLARAKAAARGLPVARFLVGDALRLEDLGLTFATVIDSGLLHAFTDRERELYVASLGVVLRPGGLGHVLCFSDEEPGTDGPRRVTQVELRAAFAPPAWELLEIAPARFLTNVHADGARAWRATVRRR